jgi:hypothetical protein
MVKINILTTFQSLKHVYSYLTLQTSMKTEALVFDMTIEPWVTPQFVEYLMNLSFGWSDQQPLKFAGGCQTSRYGSSPDFCFL